MRLRGTLLWKEAPTSDALWVTGEWLVENGVIRRVETRSHAADLEGFIIPGMVDSHCHVAIDADGPVTGEAQLAQVHASRDSGVLLMRDCGAPEDINWLHGRADLPVIIRSGQHVARPKRYIRGLPIDIQDLSDTPNVVAQQAAVSDGWVKLVGDWIDRSAGADADLEPLWPLEVLKDAVAAAHEAGARVAVHAFSHKAIDDLIEAGVDDIEHGSGMDADQLSEARARGILVTPTLLQVELFADFAAQAGVKFPKYAATMQAMYDQRVEHAQMLLSSGVTLLTGTDAGGYQAHGCLVDELTLWQRAGMSTADILDHATWRSRDVLGVSALVEGAAADLVVYAEDPRANLDVLRTPNAVVLRGQRVLRRCDG